MRRIDLERKAKESKKKKGMVIGGILGILFMVSMLIALSMTGEEVTTQLDDLPVDLSMTDPGSSDVAVEPTASSSGGGGSSSGGAWYDPFIPDWIRPPRGAPADWTKWTPTSDAGTIQGRTAITYLPNDEIYVAFTNGTGLQVSKYNGTWQLFEAVFGAADGPVAITYNSTYDIHIAWVNGVTDDLYHTYGSYGGWTNEIVDNSVNYVQGTAASVGIAINSTDAVFITAPSDLGGASYRSRLAVWNVSAWDTRDVIGAPVSELFYTSIAINSTDDLHISWSQQPSPYSLNHSYGTYDSLTAEGVHSEIGINVGFYHSIAIDSNDRIYISHMDYAGGVGVYGLNTSYYNGSWITYQVDADGVNQIGYYSDIAIDANDYAHISYKDKTDDDLKHANGTIYNWTTESVDTVGDVGSYCDITMNSTTDNVAYISYFDNTNNDLKVAYREFDAPPAPPGASSCNFINVTYTTPTYPSVDEDIDITLNYSQAANPDADVTLEWNGTEYNPEIAYSVGDLHTWRKTITIPALTAYQSIQFHFNATGMNSTCNYTANYTQEIYPFTIDDCTTNKQIVLNVSYYDEQVPATARNMTLESNFDILSINGISSDLEFNFSMYQNTSHIFCLPLGYDQTILTDMEMFYYDLAEDYAERFYYLIGHELEATTNLSLYALNDSDAVTFQMELFDIDYTKMPGSFIQTMRYYVDELVYRVVEVSRTDTQSQTINHMELEDVYYRFAVIDTDGATTYTTDPFRPFCVEYPCTKDVYVKSDEEIYDLWNQYSGITYNLSYNGSGTDLFSFTYVDSTGATSSGRLEVIGRSGSNETLICDSRVNAASATILCNMTPYVNTDGDYFANAYIERSPDAWYAQIVQTFESAYLVYGLEGVFWGMLLFGLIALTAIWNPTATIVMSVFGLAAVRMLGLIYIPWVAIMAAAVIAAVLIWRTSGNG